MIGIIRLVSRKLKKLRIEVNSNLATLRFI
jgi:hypothetical protein